MGRVGRSVASLFEHSHEVVPWDDSWADPYPQAALAACDFTVVAVHTPPLASGHADVSAVMDAVAAAPTERILLKSTVPPGTTDRLAAETAKSICFCPEYISESEYYNPYFASVIEEVPFVVLGGEPTVRRWFIDRLMLVLGPTKPYFQCTAREAEIIKYAENAYFATKITFVNELRSICEAFEADWHTVREGWLLDPRVEPMHTAAFGDRRGFSGKCLPKDLQAIVAATADAGYTAALLQEVLQSNTRFNGLNDEHVRDDDQR